MRWGSAAGALLVTGALAVTALAPMTTGAGLGEPAAGVERASATDQEGRYSLPLTGEVVAPFDDPEVPWGAGHRGVDIAGAAGAPVLAAADGVVAFAGVVVDRPVISIDHPDGIRTTYEPVVSELAAGDAVAQGQVIGRLVADGSHCGGRVCLHWGAKIGDDYIDPLALLSDPVIRLYPVDRAAGSTAGVLRGNRRLLVARQRPLRPATHVGAGHERGEDGLTRPTRGRRAVGQRRSISRERDQLRVRDLVRPPGRRVRERGNHGVAVERLAVSQHHHPVRRHQRAVVGVPGAVAERAPPLVLDREQLVEDCGRHPSTVPNLAQARGCAWSKAARSRSELMCV